MDPTAWSPAQTSQALHFSNINGPGGLQTTGFFGGGKNQTNKQKPNPNQNPTILGFA